MAQNRRPTTQGKPNVTSTENVSAMNTGMFGFMRRLRRQKSVPTSRKPQNSDMLDNYPMAPMSARLHLPIPVRRTVDEGPRSAARHRALDDGNRRKVADSGHTPVIGSNLSPGTTAVKYHAAGRTLPPHLSWAAPPVRPRVLPTTSPTPLPMVNRTHLNVSYVPTQSHAINNFSQAPSTRVISFAHPSPTCSGPLAQPSPVRTVPFGAPMGVTVTSSASLIQQAHVNTPSATRLLNPGPAMYAPSHAVPAAVHPAYGAEQIHRPANFPSVR